jgi:hypothetical protein
VKKFKIDLLKRHDINIPHMIKLPYIKVPDDWQLTDAKGPGPFITKAIFNTPKGIYYWTSRHHRKHHSTLDRSAGSTCWAPMAVGWWIGILFAIGATFFGIGALATYCNIITSSYAGLIFFIGSIFFTTAAFLQYLETINSPHFIGFNASEIRHIFSFEPVRIDWWSTVVQWIGTLFFNISTFFSILPYLMVTQSNNLVWSPDVLGSTCFLVSSYLAFAEAGHRLFSWNPGSLSWWIAFINLAGSIAFGISAIGAYISPLTGLPINSTYMDFGTFFGALCFFLGAILLLPERTADFSILEGLNSDIRRKFSIK